jgi:hypothetical protein
MYGSIDFLVAQEVMHIIGRKQAQEEGQESVLPEQMSPITRLINRLPIWTPNQPFVLETPHDETFFNSTQCE